MQIKDLQPNMGDVDLVLSIVDKQEPRSFEKFGKRGRVCNAVAQDDSGKVTITLWNDDVDVVGVGDKIHLQNGWCSEYKGEKQVSAGRFGKIEVVERTAGQKGAKEVFSNDPGIFAAGGTGAAGGDDGDDSDEDDGSEEETDSVGEEELVE